MADTVFIMPEDATVVDALNYIYADLVTSLTPLTQALNQNIYAKSSVVGSRDLSSINPMDADHSVTNVLLSLNNKLVQYATAADLTALQNAATSYARAADVAHTYATKAEVNAQVATASQTYATKDSLNNYLTTASFSDYAKTSYTGTKPISGASAKYCTATGHNNALAYTSVESITQAYDNLQGQNQAILDCASFAFNHVNENMYISSNGLLSGCAGPYSMSDANIVCLAAIQSH